MTVSEIHKSLKQHGLRITAARVSLLAALITAREPKTADELHARMDFADLVTVYRSLQSFVAAGLAKEVRFNDSIVRYELSAHTSGHHHHLVCNTCGRVEDVEGCEIESIERSVIKRSKSFKVIKTHALEFFGECKKCVTA